MNLATEFLEIKKESNTIMIDFLERFREVGQLEARTNSILLNNEYDDEFIPIIKSNYYKIEPNECLRKAAIISILVEKFPYISSEVPIDKLAEFKSDSEASLKLLRLRNWTTELTNTKLTGKEINQKLEYLLYEYKNQLDFHKLKYKTGVIETFVTSGLEIIENIAKLNLSKAAKLLFDIQRKDLMLMEAEEKLIGKEVAYFSHASKLVQLNG